MPACLRSVAFLVSLSFFLLATKGYGETEFLPANRQVFARLIADPRELQYTLRHVAPVSQKFLGEAAMGDYFGIYRYTHGDSQWQVSIGGGVFGRFELTSRSNNMQVADFYGNFPVDYRRGPWSARFMIYHTSSHLGDDYIKRFGVLAEKHAWDVLRWLVSYQWSAPLRLYGGTSYTFRQLPRDQGRVALQGGFECLSPWMSKNRVQLFWANDFQSWERSDWGPAFNSQLGFTLRSKPANPRSASFFLEYGAGRQPHGQFFLRRESRWGAGVRFELS